MLYWANSFATILALSFDLRSTNKTKSLSDIEVSDNDTGGLVIDNEGVTVYGAADNGQLSRTIDEDVCQDER